MQYKCSHCKETMEASNELKLNVESFSPKVGLLFMALDNGWLFMWKHKDQGGDPNGERSCPDCAYPVLAKLLFSTRAGKRLGPGGLTKLLGM